MMCFVTNSPEKSKVLAMKQKHGQNDIIMNNKKPKLLLINKKQKILESISLTIHGMEQELKNAKYGPQSYSPKNYLRSFHGHYSKQNIKVYIKKHNKNKNHMT